MSSAHTCDRWLLFTVLSLVLFGMVMVFSTSGMLAERYHESSTYYFSRQAMWFAVGMAVMAAARFTPYRWFNTRLAVFGGMGLSLALLVAVLAGREVQGSKRWLFVHGFTFQPSELAKICAMIFLAYVLARHFGQMRTLRPYAASGIGLGLALTLIAMQPDFGTVALLTAVAGIMFFAANMPWLYAGVFASVAALGLGGLMVTAPYRLQRLSAFLNPEADPLGAGFQLRQALMAVGSGGLWGKGLGGSEQKMFFLPKPHTDFMYAIICEEFGLIGGLILLCAFLLLLWRGLRVAWHAPDSFGTLLALGLTVAVVLQAMLHMGVTLGLLPTKGLPLPFVSYGGSSLVINCLAMGILMNISAAPEQES
jgi:cell division protein FtsW